MSSRLGLSEHAPSRSARATLENHNTQWHPMSARVTMGRSDEDVLRTWARASVERSATDYVTR
jgi:hypothetical protein